MQVGEKSERHHHHIFHKNAVPITSGHQRRISFRQLYTKYSIIIGRALLAARSTVQNKLHLIQIGINLDGMFFSGFSCPQCPITACYMQHRHILTPHSLKIISYIFRSPVIIEKPLIVDTRHRFLAGGHVEIDVPPISTSGNVVIIFNIGQIVLDIFLLIFHTEIEWTTLNRVNTFV